MVAALKYWQQRHFYTIHSRFMTHQYGGILPMRVKVRDGRRWPRRLRKFHINFWRCSGYTSPSKISYVCLMFRYSGILEVWRYVMIRILIYVMASHRSLDPIEFGRNLRGTTRLCYTSRNTIRWSYSKELFWFSIVEALSIQLFCTYHQTVWHLMLCYLVFEVSRGTWFFVL